MDIKSFFSPEIYSWVVLPAFIFFARVIDVSLGTLRIIFLARGKRNLAPVVGFFEVLIWITIIGEIVRNLTNPVAYIAYAAGFAAGNLTGMTLEERLAVGMLSVRIFLNQGGDALAHLLHDSGFGVTEIGATGSRGPVTVLYTIIRRKDQKQVVDLIHSVNPNAFFSVEEIRAASAGIFPTLATSKWNYPTMVKRK